MIAGRIKGATRYLGAPIGWEPDEQGPCAHLAIWDHETTAGEAMASVWEPTPDELDRLANGAKVILTVCGHIHPPVSLKVGAVPKDEGPG